MVTALVTLPLLVEEQGHKIAVGNRVGEVGWARGGLSLVARMAQLSRNAPILSSFLISSS